MAHKNLRIAGTRYLPMRVWDGEQHRVRVRFRKRLHVPRDRGTLHTIICRATGYRGTRHLTEARAMKGNWHSLDIGRRTLAKRFMIEIEGLAALGIVEVMLDGKLVQLA